MKLKLKRELKVLQCLTTRKIDQGKIKKSERKGQRIMASVPKALKGNKVYNKYQDVLMVLKQVKVNIPLLDVVYQVFTMPHGLKPRFTIV